MAMDPISLPSGRPAIMGVLNVTPDSFSDGGQFSDAHHAVKRGLEMVGEGADFIDVGGESTRPGSDPVSAEEEIARTAPVVETLAKQGVIVSIDTSKPEVAKRALEAGAKIVNDVTGLGDESMRETCAEFGCTVCIMHMRGTPKTMQESPRYNDVVQEVAQQLSEAATEAIEAGVAADKIWLDPGIGFGKTASHNLSLLHRLSEVCDLGHPVLVGVSRKSFIGQLLGEDGKPAPVEDRLEGTLAAQVVSCVNGARIVRCHDVQEAVRSLRVASAILTTN